MNLADLQQNLGKSEPTDPALLAAMAHELKTPLTVITHLVANLRDPSLQLTLAEQQKYLQRVELSSERMLRLIDGLGQSYRLSQANQLAFALDVEPVNIKQVCEEAAHELAPLASQLDQTVRLTMPQRHHLVVANRLLLQNVVVNLLDNALKHNPAQTTVELGVRSRQAMSRLQVRDNGPGMDRASFRQLHQKLGQEIQPTAERAGSSGLGLYIAGRLARAMGGELGAQQHRSSGMTFYVDLHQSRQLSFL